VAVLFGTVVGLLAASGGQAVAAGRTHERARPAYYLALGDSLASGYQPQFGETPPSPPDAGYPGGYARDLAAATGYRLIDLACPGETTHSYETVAALPECAAFYRATFGVVDQQAAALAFLRAHRHQVRLVTIDLGADDVLGCLAGASIKASCVAAGLKEIARELPGELATLRRAVSRDDPGARVVTMTYYDPALALAVVGRLGSALASLGITAVLNGEVRLSARLSGLGVANVAGAFATYSLFPFGIVEGPSGPVVVPHDVVVVCALTHACGSPPDVHPNDAGYLTIARAFEAVLPRR
jgi:lysophospholipase L1-like esterase